MSTYRYLYGPVPSRRLGASLGIDLIPKKICSYDCIYCQVGKTTNHTLKRKAYYPTEAIKKELKEFLEDPDNAGRVDILTFSGSGEPTLHAGIGELIRFLKEITSIPVAVITNGSLLWDPQLQEDLLPADRIVPSLDAVTPAAFEAVNRPVEGLSVSRVIEGLKAFRERYKGEIWVEVLLCEGVNDAETDIAAIKKVLDEIGPDKVQLNTVVRPPAEVTARPLSEERLREICEFLGEKAEVIASFDTTRIPAYHKATEEEILNLLRRRPETAQKMSRSLGLHLHEVEKYLTQLLRKEKVLALRRGDEIYYEIVG
ncbi:MAG: radical SAM protein [Deltaproteobacteria bacterium]|nr:MAG: radical SAM protein [Deltaproteobacteria bacterium]